MEARGFGVLCTNSVKFSGYPFGSIVNFALDAAGRPVLVMSGLAVHTKNIMADGRASLTVYDPEAENDVLAAARMSVMGDVARVPEDELAEARAVFFARHPEAEEYMELADFAVYRMEVREVYYVGGFGNMGWVAAQDFGAAEAPAPE